MTNINSNSKLQSDMVLEYKKKIGEHSIAYYGKDGTTFLFLDTNVCRKAIINETLDEEALYVLRAGSLLKSPPILEEDGEEQ
jgi:hypothetical protein